MLAGQMFDVPVLGTHAHSWIMSFPDEYTAFKEYAKLYPNACTLLVDTYDTLKSGVPNAIRVFTEMRDSGVPMKITASAWTAAILPTCPRKCANAG